MNTVLVLILVFAVLALPLAYMVRVFKRGDEMESGGSLGDQTFGERKDDDWGPKPS